MPIRHSMDDSERRRKRRVLIAVVTFACVTSLTLVVLVVVGLYTLSNRVKEANQAAAAVDRATADREGQTWALNELFSYLEAKGAVHSMRVVDHDGRDLPPEWVFKTADNRTVRVRRLGDAAAAVTDARDREPGFAWGRFSFVGDAKANDRFRQFLHQ